MDSRALLTGVGLGAILSALTLSAAKNTGPESEKVATIGVGRPVGQSMGYQARAGERSYLIAGNWKCNPASLEECENLIKTLNCSGPIPKNAKVVIALPNIYIPVALLTMREDIEIGAQDCGLVPAKGGAFTGEVSPAQLKSMGVTWVIIGHSERREGFGGAGSGESNEHVAEKVKAAVGGGLNVMICCGEKKDEREAGTTMDVIAAQLTPVVRALSAKDWEKVTIAYEPVWAIGTGLTATPEMANDTQSSIRKWLASKVSSSVAEHLIIQYGGSMKGSNSKGLLSMSDIDGGLVGGASLKPEFFDIVTNCQ